MRITKSLLTLGTLILLAVTFGCSGSGGGGDGTGTVAMSITDAKPMLPAPPGQEITNVLVTIDEVLVHKSGGGWVTLDLPVSPDPFEIDLMFYSDGNFTQLVPPAAIDAGKYTQIRLSVASAKLVFNNDPANWVDVTIPSENLKTDQNFEFTVPSQGDGTQDPNKAAVDITIDFDLSKSLVMEGNGSYKLKPVLHIVNTEAAATIGGTITNSFIDGYAVITVRDLSVNNDPNDGDNGDIYTILRVEKTAPTYLVFWLVPNHHYFVEIDYDPITSPDTDVPDASRDVPATDVEPGETATVDFPQAT